MIHKIKQIIGYNIATYNYKISNAMKLPLKIVTEKNIE